MSSTKLHAPSQSQLPFGVRAASALGVSVVADALDYLGAPIFALPVIGDVADAIVMATLYRLTGSKKSAMIQAVEFIPFLGDYVPTYTITTLMWILKELRKGDAARPFGQVSISAPNREVQFAPNTNPSHKATQDAGDQLSTRLMRSYAVLKSRFK